MPARAWISCTNAFIPRGRCNQIGVTPICSAGSDMTVREFQAAFQRFVSQVSPIVDEFQQRSG